MPPFAQPEYNHAAAEEVPGTIFGVREEIFWEPDRLVLPDSWVGHIPIAFWLTRVVQPTLFVELGTHSGNSYAAFCQAIARDGMPARSFAVDTWEGDEHAGHYGEDVFNELRRFHDRYASFSTLLRSTFDDARGYFADGSIDLLHIDGLHTYEAVRHDFETWREALSARAVVVLHDTNVRERSFGVWRLWHELAAEHPSFEFFHSHGLGLLGIGPEQPPCLRRLFAAAPEGAPATWLRQAFAARGETFRWRLRTAEQRAEREALDRERLRITEELAQSLAAVARLEQATHDNKTMLAARSDEVRRMREALRRAQDMVRERETALRRQQEEASARALMQRHEIDRLTAAIAAHEHEASEALRQARLEAQSANAELAAAFRTSTSWRLTAPLRAAGRLLHRSPVALGATAAEPPPFTPEIPIYEPSPVAVSEFLELNEPPADSREAIRAKLFQEMEGFLASPRQLSFVDERSPLLSILIVALNQAPFTLMCVRTLAAERDIPLEVIVVDNGSSDDTPLVLERATNIRVLRNATDVGFAEAANQAAGAARGSVLVLLDNDAAPRAGALAAAIATLRSSSDVGAVGGRLVLPTGRLHEAGSIIWRDGTANCYARGLEHECAEAMFRRDVDCCSGAFLITPRQVFQRLDGFDRRYAPAHCEVADYCMRLREVGLRVVYQPAAAIDYLECASEARSAAGLAVVQRSRVAFRQRHAATLARAHLPPTPDNTLSARTAAPRPRELLVLDDFVPLGELGAGFPRSKEMLNSSVDLGWGVTFYAMQMAELDWPTFWAQLNPAIEIIVGRGDAGLREFLKERRGFYDVVLISRPHNMEPLVKILDEEGEILGGAKLVYDAEAVYTQRNAAERELRGEPLTAEAEKDLFDEEIRLARRADMVLAVSPADARLLAAPGAPPVHVLSTVPRIAPTEREFCKRSFFLFVGRLADKLSPNYDGLSWFVRTVWPLIRARIADARLMVVGPLCVNPGEIRAPGVELVGKLSDLHDMYDAARVFIAPARFAAGIPLKVVEAAAAGVPVVGSQLLADQLLWQKGEEILVASDPEGFAKHSCAVFEDSSLWQRVRSGAMRRIMEDYSRSAFEETLRFVLEGHDSPPASPQSEYNRVVQK